MEYRNRKPETRDQNTETGIWNLKFEIIDIENDERKALLQQC